MNQLVKEGVLKNKTSDIKLSQKRIFSFSFLAVLGYIFIEYFRPQDWVPALQVLPLGMIIAMVCFVILLVHIPKISWSRLTILLIAFLLIIAKSVPFAYNNFYAFTITKMFTIMLLGGILPLMTFVDSLDRMNTLFRFFILIVIAQSLNGIMHGRGVGGFMGDENDFALLLNITIPFSYFLITSEKSEKWKIIFYSSLGLYTVAIASSLSRGGFLGLICVGLFCWLKSKRKIAALLIIIIVAGCLVMLAPATYWEEMASIKTATQRGDTGDERFVLWEIAWRMFLDDPIMGVGAGNYQATVDLYYLPSDRAEREDVWHGGSLWGKPCHSVYFTIISELAAPGAVVFILIIWFIWKEMSKVERAVSKYSSNKNISGLYSTEEIKQYYSNALAIKGGLIGFLSTGAFISVLYYPFFWTLVAFAEIVRSNFEKQIHNYEIIHPVPNDFRSKD